nr:hypothetical protein [Pararhodospirillum photometricum]
MTNRPWSPPQAQGGLERVDAGQGRGERQQAPPFGDGPAFSARLGRWGDEAADHRHHLVNVEGFGDEIVHPGFVGGISLGIESPGGQGDHGHRGNLAGMAQAARGLVAIHDRHLDVHQHHVEGARHGREPAQGFAPVFHQGDKGAFQFQDPPRDLAIEGVVLGHQDADPRQTRSFLGAGSPKGQARGQMALASGSAFQNGVTQGGGRDRLGQEGVDHLGARGQQDGFAGAARGGKDQSGRGQPFLRAQGARGGEGIGRGDPGINYDGVKAGP